MLELGISYLERRVWNDCATNAIDGSLSTLSGRTAAYRTKILQHPEFYHYFLNDTWRGKPLTSDDDKYLTRYVYSQAAVFIVTANANVPLVKSLQPMHTTTTCVVVADLPGPVRRPQGRTVVSVSIFAFLTYKPKPVLDKPVLNNPRYTCDDVPDQDFLINFFSNRWIGLLWKYNAVKTMAYRHENLWDKDQIVCLHYIVDKPWAKRIGEDGIAEFKCKDGETHRWWWDEYGAKYDGTIDAQKKKLHVNERKYGFTGPRRCLVSVGGQRCASGL
ncbi:hypothetical protein PRZ48_005223 [Zasmidium cellare]|uniref:Uncharacterized protein n=1 Tax=Zasmidium cellare TaxID=395010 RepID=A0ABR0ES54_ZASCE|nr:hypothetical protein PRZ48_005223 [Zasmidium cellare]